jgi:hypothetical protein
MGLSGVLGPGDRGERSIGSILIEKARKTFRTFSNSGGADGFRSFKHFVRPEKHKAGFF